MNIYYDENGTIVTMSEDKIEVANTSVLVTTRDINPLLYEVKNKKLVKLKTGLIDSTIVKEEEPSESEIFINTTDWKVTRHRDQLDLGIETSLSEEEFQQLLLDRQDARDTISGVKK